MTHRAVVRAFANIALIKYWGKRPGLNNVPATPSISLAIEALKTETTVSRSNMPADEFILNSAPMDRQASLRMKNYLDYWRSSKLLRGRFVVESKNYFPTQSGLASSSSGYAALAFALSVLAERKISPFALTKLARIGSGSAARSVAGGLAVLPPGVNPGAKTLIAAERVPWGMVIVNVEGEEKLIGSRAGMEHCRRTSPYYQAWVRVAIKDFKLMLKAITNNDFTQVGEITESNALAMHAAIMASRPGLVYLAPASLEVIQAVRRWRRNGFESYVTIDAGRHPVILGRNSDLTKIARRIKQIKGVKSATIGRPAPGAKVIDFE